MRRGRFERTAHLVTLLSFLLLYAPLLAMVGLSFLAPSAGPDSALEPSLRWYRQAGRNEAVIDAVRTSVEVALASTFLSLLIGTAGAYALERSRFPGRRWLAAFTYVPLVMPEIVLGLSLLVWFVVLRLTLGTFSLVLAHVTFSVSYVLIAVRARLQGMDRSLEDAALDLGASPFRAFLHVTLPLLFPGILAGGLMAFTLSFDDFLVSFFTSGPGSDTLPLKIYSMIKFGISPEIHALSAILLGVTLAAVVTISAVAGSRSWAK